MSSISLKKCVECKKTKPLSEFNKQAALKDGYRNLCKLCDRTKARVWASNNKKRRQRTDKNWRERNTERVRNNQKKYYQNNKGKFRTLHKEYLKRHPDRHKARISVGHEVRMGRMPPASKQICVDCDRPAQEYDHHKGYAKEYWLTVQPVCTKCHGKRHRIVEI